MIGVVIGKGGDMIKMIQQESGARIQFRPEDELGGPNRMCNITGSVEQTQAAHNMIQKLVDNTAVRPYTLLLLVHPSACLCVSLCLSVRPSVCLCVCVSVRLCVSEIWLHQAVKFDFMGRSDRYRKLIRRSNKVIMLASNSKYWVGSNFFHL